MSTNASENNAPKNTRLTSKPQFQSLLEKINNPQHGRLVPEKIINLSNNNLQNSDILLLVQKLQYQALNLDLLDFSKNQIGFTGVENILYSFRFDAPNGRYIVTMNLSNNITGDNGAEYIATSLKWGRYPHLKALDVSGNLITPTGHGYIAQALKDINQKISVTLIRRKKFPKQL
ncbi:MAG TPA: hypothetical protein LFW14_05615 [Rickettsia endosymbiont of Degeeriella rufa]|nr:hypothetical protein [Rickettsia endosymbiont of Degeeriella rufa]